MWFSLENIHFLQVVNSSYETKEKMPKICLLAKFTLDLWWEWCWLNPLVQKNVYFRGAHSHAKAQQQQQPPPEPPQSPTEFKVQKNEVEENDESNELQIGEEEDAAEHILGYDQQEIEMMSGSTITKRNLYVLSVQYLDTYLNVPLFQIHQRPRIILGYIS